MDEVAVELPFLLFDVALGLLASREDRARRRRRREQVAQALERVAEALGGRVVRPWWGRVRVEALVDGRPVRIEWLGRGRVGVTGPAPGVVEVRAWRRTGWLARLLARLRGQGEVVVQGASASRHGAAEAAVRAGTLDHVEVARGDVSARATTGTSAGVILDAVHAAMDLAWTVPDLGGSPLMTVSVRPAVTARPAAPRPGASTTGDGPLRCPYCHDDLAPEAVVVHCASCDAPHHPSCFEEGAGCSIAGCAQRVARGVRARAG